MSSGMCSESTIVANTGRGVHDRIVHHSDIHEGNMLP